MKKPDIKQIKEALAKLILEAGDQYTEEMLGSGLTETENGVIIHYDHPYHLEDYSVEIEIKEPVYNSIGLETEEND
jgi:hypothetical protein